MPLGGGQDEPLSCKGTTFGKTVWYDLAPQVNGGVQIRATGGFNTVVAVYQWNPVDSQIMNLVGCSANAASEDLLLDVKGKRNYTIQVGGAANTGGPLGLKVDFFPDTDADTILDALDKCPTTPGIERFGGCPPETRVVPSIGFDATGSGVIIRRLIVDKVPKGAKVLARCSGCGSQTIKAKRLGRVSLTKLVGKTVPAGASIEIKVTLRKTGTGQLPLRCHRGLLQMAGARQRARPAAHALPQREDGEDRALQVRLALVAAAFAVAWRSRRRRTPSPRPRRCSTSRARRSARWTRRSTPARGRRSPRLRPASPSAASAASWPSPRWSVGTWCGPATTASRGSRSIPVACSRSASRPSRRTCRCGSPRPVPGRSTT